jgi:hypothetical protein
MSKPPASNEVHPMESTDFTFDRTPIATVTIQHFNFKPEY